MYNLQYYDIVAVELMLRRDTFTVIEGDPGFNSSVLIFVDIVNSTIGQQMVDLDFNVFSTPTISQSATIKDCLHNYYYALIVACRGS